VPVNVLLCEGVGSGPDMRLLRAVLPITVVGEVRPSGGKDGFRNLISNLRRAENNPSICGLADGDFPRKPAEWTPPTQCREWRVRSDGTETMLGWMWQRKEIENYLIDPVVVARALEWDEVRKNAYIANLERVFDKIAAATAGRIALTEHAPRRTRLETSMRIDAADAEVRQTLKLRAAEHNDATRIDEAKLLQSYEGSLFECHPGGKFRARALEVFAGKDILAKIQQTAGFPREVKNREELIERVLSALGRDMAPHTWLPEWSALYAALDAWRPPP
jgi:hypothetical protein